jgi:hypothetical protein
LFDALLCCQGCAESGKGTLERLTAVIAAGWQDPANGLVLPWSPRLSPQSPHSVWHVLRREGVAEEDMVRVVATLIERHGVVRIRFHNPTQRRKLGCARLSVGFPMTCGSSAQSGQRGAGSVSTTATAAANQ